MTDRERFLAVLAGGPIMPPNAVVMLCGEDWEPRMQRTVGRFLEIAQWAAHKQQTVPEKVRTYKPVVMLTGGRHEPPTILGARQIAPKMVGLGVAHDRILLDTKAMNTREQAENVIAAAEEHDWGRLMLVASPYHTPRAFLTFLGVLQERDLTGSIELLPDSADHTPWFTPPDGMAATRVDLLEVEFHKIETYTDHVASYADGLDYLEYWESHVPELEAT